MPNTNLQWSPPPSDRSLQELFSDLVYNAEQLLRQEFELAKKETKHLAESLKSSLLAMSSGVVIGLTGAVLLSMGIAIGLTWIFMLLGVGLVPSGLMAFLTLGVLFLLTSSSILSAEKKKLKENLPKLEKTTKTLKEDTRWIKQKVGAQ